MLTLEPFSKDQVRSAVHPSGGSHQSASLRLTGQRPERADAEARLRHALPAIIEETTFHERIKSPVFGRPPIHAGPRPGSIGVPTHRHSTSDRGASPAPIRFPPKNFKHSLTLLSKSFSSFPCDTCSLSVSRPYLALDGILRPIWAAFPNNPTRRQRLVVRQEHLSAKGSWSPDARRDVAAKAKRVELQPPLGATFVDVDLNLGQARGQGAREASILPTMTAHPVIEARCEGATRCVKPRQICPRPNGFGHNLRSKS
ncbi:Protein TAR1 [Capsicum baccatum]|uniref:Protein TAR1 n=1 Tax=Capsicum baccatum TaxID=33114 RepID=A0A2G2V1B8_CAPBA|nr:Protein TAR1 [Capsicum baccatum]